MDPSLTEAFLSWPIQGALYHGMGLGLLASTAAGRERAVGSIIEIMEPTALSLSGLAYQSVKNEKVVWVGNKSYQKGRQPSSLLSPRYLPLVIILLFVLLVLYLKKELPNRRTSIVFWCRLLPKM